MSKNSSKLINDTKVQPRHSENTKHINFKKQINKKLRHAISKLLKNKQKTL